jgi:hypothetical protein
MAKIILSVEATREKETRKTKNVMEGRNDDRNAEQRTQYSGCSRQTALEYWHGKAALAV